jgi:hypothetical protein
MAGEEQLCELGREGTGRLPVRPVRVVGFVSAVGGVRDHAARLVEPALDLLPALAGVDAAPDARDLDLEVDDGASGDPLDLDDIGPIFGKGCDAFAACRVLCRPHRDDAPHALALRQRLTDEQVDVGLQEAAGAELNDRERHAGQISIRALITPVWA